MEQGNILYIGTPITLLLIAVMSFAFVAIEIKKRRLDLKLIVGWFITNLFYSIILIYILIDAILQYFNISHSINIFTWIARHAFGFDFGNQEWVILLIFGFISFILIMSMVNSIRVQRLNKRVDELNRSVAILSGKVNKTVNYEPTSLAINKKTPAEIKRELREELKIAKAQIKQKEKLKQLQITTISKSSKPTKKK